MRRLLGLSALILVGSLGAAKPSDTPRLTHYGLGDIKIGMTETQARKLGFKDWEGMAPEEAESPEYVGCHYISATKGYPGVSLMIIGGKVVRVDIYEDANAASWQSHSGVAIGMAEAAVLNIYGSEIKVSPHP